ncbi:hypothetical protein SDC9_117379 [bioreactor metagenome]|uniref:Uncharacterized protein n=1 Tax=bioreactor metagenome TaxID=1076179 RepID=A0A645C894_9ZZZZ
MGRGAAPEGHPGAAAALLLIRVELLASVAMHRSVCGVGARRPVVRIALVTVMVALLLRHRGLLRGLQHSVLLERVKGAHTISIGHHAVTSDFGDAN